MTRKEAVDGLFNIAPSWTNNFRLEILEALCFLGAIKLDDPEEKDRIAAIELLRGVFVRISDDRRFGPSIGQLSFDSAAEVIDLLLKSGFKITR